MGVQNCGTGIAQKENNLHSRNHVIFALLTTFKVKITTFEVKMTTLKVKLTTFEIKIIKIKWQISQQPVILER